MRIEPKDRALLALLSDNARAPITELAKKLHLSRSTVKDRLRRLETSGIITGYTVRFDKAYSDGQILSHVLISADPKKHVDIVRSLRQLPALKTLYAVNGIYDMIATLVCESTRSLDETLDEIGSTDGVDKTVSSIVLSTKIDR